MKSFLSNFYRNLTIFFWSLCWPANRDFQRSNWANRSDASSRKSFKIIWLGSQGGGTTSSYAQWICLCLPTCSPGFHVPCTTSTILNLNNLNWNWNWYFFSYRIVKRININRKRGRERPIFTKPVNTDCCHLVVMGGDSCSRTHEFKPVTDIRWKILHNNCTYRW